MKYFQDNLSEMREDVRKMKTSKIDLERDANDRSQKKVHIEGQLKQVVVSLLQFFFTLLMQLNYFTFLGIIKLTTTI